MKKLVLMAVAAMMATISVNAQSDEQYLKHEISVGYGAISNADVSALGEALGSIIVSAGQFTYNDGSITGPISLEYYYHINPVIGVGGVAVYAKEKKDMFLSNDRVGDCKNTYISVMPSIKFNWLRTKYFGMYSKAAAGLCFVSQKRNWQYSSETKSDSDTKTMFTYQLTGIGLEAGPQNVKAFAELGIGEQGILLAGLRVKF